MIYCSSCGLANRDGSRFCNECGMRLGVDLPCPACGGSNLSTSRFCNFCGTQLSSSPSNVSSESAAILHGDGEEIDTELESSTPSLPSESNVVAVAVAPEPEELPGTCIGPDSQDHEVAIPVADLGEVSPPLEEPAWEPSVFAAPPEESVPGQHAVVDPAMQNELGTEISESLKQVVHSSTALAEDICTADPLAAPAAPSIAAPAALLDMDELLPGWLAESEEVVPEQTPEVALEEPATEDAVSEEPEMTRSLPWERAGGITLARSISYRHPRIRDEEQSQHSDNGGTVFLQALSSPDQPLSEAAPTEEPRKATKRGRWVFRRVLVYCLIVALIVLAAVQVSQSTIPFEIGSILGGW